MSSIGLSFGDSTAEDRPRSLTSAVQERLRADILSTRLLPGQKLHIAGLAKQFSVSLAAVREALSRLVADALVNACGSPWLLGFRDVLHEQSERYRRLAIRRNTEKSRNVEAEHAAIVRATLKRDADAAVAALSKHFMTTMRLVELATLDTPGSSTF